MANILAAGTTAADSTEVSLATGVHAVLALIGSDGAIPADAYLAVQYEGSDEAFYTAAVLSASNPVHRLIGPGVWRVSRTVVSSAVGVDSLEASAE